MSAASNFTVRRGEPPVDYEAENQIKDIQLWQLSVLTSESTAVRKMLLVSGLLSKKEEEQVERALGEVMGILEAKYQAVIDGEPSRHDNFFTAVKKAKKSKSKSPRVLRRRAYYFSSRDSKPSTPSNPKSKTPQTAPGSRDLDDYLKNVTRFRQTKLKKEEQAKNEK